MPVSFRIGECKFFYKYLFPLEVFCHFFNRDVVILNGWRFAVAFNAHKIELNNKCWLMCFGALGNGERMMKRKIVCFVLYFH